MVHRRGSGLAALLPSVCLHPFQQPSPQSAVLSPHAPRPDPSPSLPCPPADTQKAVVRTPFISSLHVQPEQYAPLPLGAAKIVAGLVHGGPWGALKMALSRS